MIESAQSTLTLQRGTGLWCSNDLGWGGHGGSWAVGTCDRHEHSPKASDNLEYLDSTPPYITDVKFPSGYARDTHSTAIQFTVKDDHSGLGVSCYEPGYLPGGGGATIPCIFKVTPEFVRADGSFIRSDIPISRSYEKGKKECEVLYHTNKIYNIGPARIKLKIYLIDEVGNSITQTIYSEPTIPYEPMLTDGFTGEQDLKEIYGYQLAGTKGSKTGYLQTVKGEGKCIVYAGPSSKDNINNYNANAEYRVSGWIADGDTQLTGIQQYQYTLEYGFGSGLGGNGRIVSKITKISNYNSYDTKNNVAYGSNTFKICHSKGSKKFISVTNFEEPITYSNLKAKGSYVMIDPSLRLTNSAENRETIATKVLNEYFSH